MRCRLFLLFIVLFLFVNVEAKTLSSPESKTVNEFENGDSSYTVEDEEVLYIDVPKDVNLVSATLDIEGKNANNVRIKINDNLLFENSSLGSTITLDLINNISTNCDIICRLRLDIRADGDIVVKNLLINYTFTRTPLFVKYMKDVKFSESKTDAFDLDNYFYGSDVVYKNMTSKTDGLDHIDVKIESNNEVSFFAEPGWEGTGYVYFVADDDNHTARSNEIKLTVGSGETKSYQFSPSNSTVVLTKGDQQTFGVSGSGNFSVDWYMDGNLTKSNSFTYAFDANKVGINKLEAKIGSTTRLWMISVLEPEIVSPELPPEIEEIEEPVCGNGIREENEDCGNCPEDVKCAANAECVNGKCTVVEKKSDLKWLVLPLIIFGSVVVLVVAGIIFVKKYNLNLFKIFKKKISEKKEEDLTPLRDYLMGNLKKGYKKEDLINAALKQGWNKEQIDKILNEQKPVMPKEEPLPEELIPLKNYIKDSIMKGYKREDLINAALKIGWKKEQIDEVLRKI